LCGAKTKRPGRTIRVSLMDARALEGFPISRAGVRVITRQGAGGSIVTGKRCCAGAGADSGKIDAVRLPERPSALRSQLDWPRVGAIARRTLSITFRRSAAADTSEIEGGARNADLFQRPPHRQSRLLDQPDDFKLLAGGVRPCHVPVGLLRQRIFPAGFTRRADGSLTTRRCNRRDGGVTTSCEMHRGRRRS
jgi:hypothetical protein